MDEVDEVVQTPLKVSRGPAGERNRVKESSPVHEDIIPEEIQTAIKTGRVRKVDIWLRKTPPRVIQSSHDGRHRHYYSPLQLAVASGNLQMVKTMAVAYVDMGVMLSFPAGAAHEMDVTALSLAIEGGKYDIAKVLLDCGTSLKHNLDTNETAGTYYLSLACSYPMYKSDNSVDIVSLLLQYLYADIEAVLTSTANTTGLSEADVKKGTFTKLCSIMEMECRPVGAHGEVSKYTLLFIYYS